MPDEQALPQRQRLLSLRALTLAITAYRRLGTHRREAHELLRRNAFSDGFIWARARPRRHQRSLIGPLERSPLRRRDRSATSQARYNRRL
jgi:hypothetical protein